jgi:hypothetical protein
VVRAIQLHHFPKAGFAFAPLPMDLAAAAGDPQAFGQQPAPQCFMINGQAFAR